MAVFVSDPFKGAVPFWRWWIWIVLGLVAEVLIVGTTLADADVRARVASQLIRDQFDLDALADSDLREPVARALSIREQMETMLQRTRDGVGGGSLRVLADDVSNWIAAMYALARRVDDLRGDATVRRNRSAIPAAIRTLEGRLAAMTGTSDAVRQARADLERALAEKRADWAQVEELDKLVESALSQLNDSQGAMEQAFTQIQLAVAREASTGRRKSSAGRAGQAVQPGRGVSALRDDIADRVHSLAEIGQEIAESHYQLLERLSR